MKETKTAKKLAAVLMLVSFVFAAVSPAMAGITIDTETGAITSDGAGNYSLSMGFAAYAHAGFSVAMGTGTHAKGSASMAMGSMTNASGDCSTAMGKSTHSSGNYSVSMGYASNAAGAGSFAGGGYYNSSIDKAAGGKAYGRSSFAFGEGAVAGDSSDEYGTAGTIALGNNAKATHANSVALGNDSETTEADTISVGKAGSERKIMNVASGGTLTVNGTNAANIGDIFGETRISANKNYVKTANTAAENLVALDTALKPIDDVVASKNLDAAAAAQATGAGATAIGWGNVAGGERSTAVGYGNVVTGTGSGAFGDPNNVTGSGSYAIGNDNTIAQNNTFVLGNNVTTTQANSVILGNASADKAGAAVTSAAINGTTYNFASGTAGSAANGVVSVGSNSAPRQIVNVANGSIVSGSLDAVNGGQIFDIINNLPSGGGAWTAKVGSTNLTVDSSNPLEFAAGDGIELTPDGTSGNKITIKATGGSGGEDANAVHYDRDAGGAKLNSITLNNGTTAQITIKNVAAGNADTDAVNVAQLKEVKNDVANLGSEVTTLGEAVNTGWNAKVGDTTLNVKPSGNDLTFKAANDNVVIKADATTNTITIDARGATDIAAAHYDAGTEQKIMTLGGNGGTTIKNVAAGEVSPTSMDAVNGAQLYARDLAISANTQEIREVGAISAALAGLHFVEPSGEEGDKLVGAVAYGGYRGANAEAIGLAYKPNPNMMLSASTSISNGNDSQNAYNVGFSLKFGKGETAVTRAALQKQVQFVNEENRVLKTQIENLSAENAEQGAKIAEQDAENAALKDTVAKQGGAIETLKKENAEIKQMLKKLIK